MPHDTHGGISNPVLGMLLFITSEVMFFGGLFAAYFSIRANAAQWPPINTETGDAVQARDPALRRPGDDPADHQLVHLPVRGLGDPARRPDPVPPGDDRHGRPRHHLPAHAGHRLHAPRLGGPDALVRDVYGTTYYTLTGFHGAHVFGGVIMLSVVLYRGMAGQFSAQALRCRRSRLALLALRRRRLDPAVLAAVPAARQDADDLGVDRHASTPAPAQRRPRRHHLHRHRLHLLGRPDGRRPDRARTTWSRPGTTMLLFLGVAMAIMAYVLVAGSSDE